MITRIFCLRIFLFISSAPFFLFVLEKMSLIERNLPKIPWPFCRKAYVITQFIVHWVHIEMQYVTKNVIFFLARTTTKLVKFEVYLFSSRTLFYFNILNRSSFLWSIFQQTFCSRSKSSLITKYKPQPLNITKNKKLWE